MRISSISIERPVFALMLVLGLVVLGLVSLSRLNLDLNPNFGQIGKRKLKIAKTSKS